MAWRLTGAAAVVAGLTELMINLVAFHYQFAHHLDFSRAGFSLMVVSTLNEGFFFTVAFLFLCHNFKILKRFV